MLLYHGSNTDIKEIDLAMCRPYKDFGQGFYLTVMKEQAEKMAKRVAILFRQYENGMITFENMLSGMIYKETTNQYSFHTLKAVSLLRKVGA